MVKRNRKVGSYATELVKKAREAILAAVQIYNNPQIEFKSELFIVTSIIAWTYLLHAYYRKSGVEYRQVDPVHKGERKRYLKTRHGAIRHWSVEECLEYVKCPVDAAVVRNLTFLIGIRHEIEHQMTNRIDDTMSAKFMACALNFNAAIKKLFGKKYSLETEQAFSIQFSSIDENTAKNLMAETDLPQHIRSYIVQFQAGMSQDDFDDPRFSYRVAFVKKVSNNKNTADKVVQFVPSGTEAATAINDVIFKETERIKYKPKSIVAQMNDEGFTKFNMQRHVELWKAKDAKNVKHQYGVQVEDSWYWYEAWLTVVRKHCQEKEALYKPPASIFPEPEQKGMRQHEIATWPRGGKTPALPNVSLGLMPVVH
jgi:Protein of unknown function (DUF3644)